MTTVASFKSSNSKQNHSGDSLSLGRRSLRRPTAPRGGAGSPCANARAEHSATPGAAADVNGVRMAPRGSVVLDPHNRAR